VEFSRIDVSEWLVSDEEAVGANEKYWLRDPIAPAEPANLWLFKPVTVHKNGHSQGGDWAELIAGELARVLTVPSAEIRLASRSGRDGTLSRNVRPSMEWDRHTGAIWMDSVRSIAYRARSSADKSAATSGYTLSAVATSLEGLGAPPQAADPVGAFDAFGVFAGYLVLDALISNRDRHEQNWSVLRHALGTEPARLAAAYDNEGGLGYNLTDEFRERVLAEPSRFAKFVSGGTAWRFDWQGRPLPTLTATAIEAVRMLPSDMSHYWREQVETLDEAIVQAIVDGVPGMAEAARRFAVNLVMANAKGIRDGFRD